MSSGWLKICSIVHASTSGLPPFIPVLCAAPRDPLSSVDTLIGTRKSKIGYRGTMPFASPPFAMTNWKPQTRQNKISLTSWE
jgi:putative alpha-1,2-mannosidase